MTDQRPANQVSTWEETFISMAQVVAKRSKDPSTQVGAVIVSSESRILSVGYNGAPRGMSDDAFPWGKQSENELENKYLFVVHGERNAILNYRGSLADFNGAHVYVTHFPCNECAKEIAQVGIKHLSYVEDYNPESDIAKASSMILEAAGVNVKRVSL